MSRRRPLTPEERTHRARSLAGQIGANLRVAAPDYDGKAATQPATAGRWAKLYAQVDPEARLDPAERHQKAQALLRAQLAAGKLKQLHQSR